MVFKKLKISQKLFFGFGIFAVVILAVFGYTYMNFQKVDRMVDANLTIYQVLQESDGILNSLIKMETYAGEYANTGEDRFLKSFYKRQDDFAKHFTALWELVSQEKGQLDRLNHFKRDYHVWLKHQLSILDKKRHELNSPVDGTTIQPDYSQNAAGRIRMSNGHDIMADLQSILDDIYNVEKLKLEEKSNTLKDIKVKTYLSILFGAVIAAIFAVLISLIFSLSITKPIKLLIQATENITKQHYQQPIDLESNMDLGALIKDFNAMQVAIKVREDALKRKNDEIKTQMQETDEANRLKSQFLANMSHELRTPLNSIIGFTARTIKKCADILPPAQLENLKIVKTEANHLLELINDLLDYSKLEAGKVELHPEQFNFIEVIEEVNKMANVILEGKPLTFEYEFFNDMIIPITSDRLKVKQIIINLMSNAIKYSDEGTIKLSVEAVDDMYCSKIKDEGIGIAEENLDNIFDEFRQVDGSYTRKAGGTGLGLSITKKYIKMLGGRIEVSSVLGAGSCFTVWLPTRIPGQRQDTDR